MGNANSSVTRVWPVFDTLLDLDPSGQSWLLDFLKMAPGFPDVDPGSLLCVFRSMPATSSGACRAMIPVHVGPPFRSMPAGGCDAG